MRWLDSREATDSIANVSHAMCLNELLLCSDLVMYFTRESEDGEHMCTHVQCSVLYLLQSRPRVPRSHAAYGLE